jgi:RNA polymerase sigma-70 factor (sigma-E family)
MTPARPAEPARPEEPGAAECTSSAEPDPVAARSSCTAGPPPWNAALGRVPAGWPASEAELAIMTMYHKEYQSLVRMSAVLLGDVGSAEEVVQDSFIAVHAAWRRLRDIDKALPYLRRSVLNRSRSLLRHRTVVDRHLPKAEPDMPSAEQAVIAQFERTAVITGLLSLPARQREALVLKFYLDLSEEQVAAAMKISTGAVKSHTARGKAALRSVLERLE